MQAKTLPLFPQALDSHESHSRPGQPVRPITGLITRAFRRALPDNTPHLAVRRYLMFPNSRIIEYPDDVVFLFHLPHLVYHLPAPLPGNSIISATVVSVILILIAFIIENSSLDPLLEGLLARVHINCSSRYLARFEPETCG